MPDDGQGIGDFSMLDLFRAEIETHAPALNESLLALEKDPSQPKRLEALMRAAHSIKGAARIVDVDPAVKIAHVMEDSFVAAQRGEIVLTSDAVDILLRGVDALSRIAQSSEEQLSAWADGGDTPFQQLLVEISAVRTGIPSKPSTPKTPPPSKVEPRIVVTGQGEKRTVAPSGNLDVSLSGEFQSALVGLLEEGVAGFRLDLTQVHEVHPAGLAVLAALPRTTSRRGGIDLEVIGADARLATLFRSTGLDQHYRFAEGGN